eukprot:Transcript_28307.p1 GENE.Transcript_28307~~Transcript_28307.p1  ORF type:complete len:261 (+),score=20.14 Transcript_28307:28-810(+)
MTACRAVLGSASRNHSPTPSTAAQRCTTAACAPATGAERMAVGFQRRLDLLAGRVEPQECASIEAIGSTGVLEDTIEVQQRPPAQACPFDLYVWVPAALAAAGPATDECGGAVGVGPGSSIKDGRSNPVQWEASCAVDLPSPSPPPRPAPPAPPPRPLPPASPPTASDEAPGDISGAIGSLEVAPLVETMPSTWDEDGARSASLDHLKALSPLLRTPERRLRRWGGSPWPQQPASGRPKDEDSPLPTTRWGLSLDGRRWR